MAQLAALDMDPNVSPIRQQPTVLSYASDLPHLLQPEKPDLNWSPRRQSFMAKNFAALLLLVVGHIVLLHDCLVIPIALRPEVLEHLHGVHSSVTPMYSRAVSSLYWPSMREDILHTRDACSDCNLNAPSNPFRNINTNVSGIISQVLLLGFYYYYISATWLWSLTCPGLPAWSFL